MVSFYPSFANGTALTSADCHVLHIFFETVISAGTYVMESNGSRDSADWDTRVKPIPGCLTMRYSVTDLSQVRFIYLVSLKYRWLLMEN